MLTCLKPTQRQAIKRYRKQFNELLSIQHKTVETSVAEHDELFVFFDKPAANNAPSAFALIERTAQQSAKLKALIFNTEFENQNEEALISLLVEELYKLGCKYFSCPNKQVDEINAIQNHQLKQTQLLEATWHRTIPLSSAMNLKASFYDQVQFTTTADKAFNQNLHNTMFAGSIYTHATLTGWGWVYLLLKDHNLEGDIVLADANIKYLSPITGQPLAISYSENNTQISSQQADELRRQKNIRLNVKVTVFNGNHQAAEFTGQYVVLPTKTKNT